MRTKYGVAAVRFTRSAEIGCVVVPEKVCGEVVAALVKLELVEYSNVTCSELPFVFTRPRAIAKFGAVSVTEVTAETGPLSSRNTAPPPRLLFCAVP